jgi:hypothetical protein
MAIHIGDAILRFLADTSDLEQATASDNSSSTYRSWMLPTSCWVWRAPAA